MGLFVNFTSQQLSSQGMKPQSVLDMKLDGLHSQLECQNER